MLLVTSKTVPEPEDCVRCCVLQGDPECVPSAVPGALDDAWSTLMMPNAGGHRSCVACARRADVIDPRGRRASEVAAGGPAADRPIWPDPRALASDVPRRIELGLSEVSSLVTMSGFPRATPVLGVCPGDPLHRAGCWPPSRHRKPASMRLASACCARRRQTPQRPRCSGPAP